MPATKPTRVMLMLAAIVWLASCGCSSIRVPAIDPTGAAIFAPSGSYTTLETPGSSLLPASCLPRPVFAEPASVPVCETPGPVMPQIATVPVQPRPMQAVAVANTPDRLLLTPSKIVAPVGSEVILLAGLSGADGYFVTRQPVEWLLSQESVGNFIDVGEDDHPTLSALLHRTPDMRSGNFAVARTTSRSKTITRGTPSPGDDVWLQKGQTWVTLTSASEGISHVTAVATDSDNWEQRRQTATIQWIDAQWQLPSPTVVRAGQPQILTTTINRTSSRSAVSGWIVRYDILSGPAAGFGPDRRQSIPVPTDTSGKATVSLQSLRSEPGVTQVKIEILAPSLTGLDGQPVVVGQGVTSVTWSAAGLAVRITGPATAAAGGTLDYQIEVTNPGDLPAESVVVTTEIPEGVRVESPQDGIVGGAVRWELDRLPPRGSHRFDLRCRSMVDRAIRLSARAAANGITSDRAHFDTQVTESALRVSMELAGVDDPSDIVVGDRVSFNVEVTNIGNETLTNVKIRDTHEVGLEEVHGASNPILYDVASLPPGHSWQHGLTFTVKAPGQLCHTLEASADGGHEDSIERCVQAAAPKHGFTMELRGPEEVQTGDPASFKVIVTNTGGGELTGVRVVFRADRSLLLDRATDEATRPETGELVWTIPSLGVNRFQEFDIVCNAIAANNAAVSTALVETGQLTDSKRVTTVIRPSAVAGVAPPGPPRPEVASDPGPQPPTNGALQVTVADLDPTIRVGGTVSYIIEIENNRQVSDKQLVIAFYLPEGSRFVTLVDDATKLPIEGFSVSPDGLAISLNVKEIRPGEKLPTYRLQVEGLQAGTMKLQVEVRSLLSGDQPIIATEDTRVDAN